MDKYFIYITESILCLGTFYLAYWLVLRRKINHRFSRYFLLSAMLLSVLLPMQLFTIDTSILQWNKKQPVTAIGDLKESYEHRIIETSNSPQAFIPLRRKNHNTQNNMVVVSNAEAINNANPKLSWLNALLIVYIAGTSFLLLRMAIQILQLSLLIKRSKTTKLNGIYQLEIADEIAPFSFGNYLFLPKSVSLNPEFHSIIEHEKAHIRQRHTVDLILTELICAIQWINPFVWLVRKALRKIHEYLADEQIVRNGYDIYAYQALMLQHLIYPKSMGLSSAFHFKSFNQRIAMIAKLQTSVPLYKRITNMIPATLIILLSIAIGIVISCSQREVKTYSVVDIKGVGSYINFSTSNFGYVLKADSVHSTALLARQGDVISQDAGIIYHHNGKTDGYQLTSTKNVVFNNGKVFSIHFTADTTLNPFLNQLDSMDLSGLESICIDQNTPQEHLIYIAKIAAKKPNIGIEWYQPEGEWSNVVNKFQPIWLSRGEISQEIMAEFAPMPNLEMLLLSFSDTVIEKRLPAFPKLKYLILNEMKNQVHFTSNFLANNPQIESVILSGCKIENYDFLKPLKKLQSLSISDSGNELDIEFLKEHTSLNRLSIINEKVNHWNVVTHLPDLKWLVLYGDISQTDFDAIASEQSKLEVLELLECDSIKNLHNLSHLSKLTALTISNKNVFDLQSLLAVKGLNYLSLPTSALEDSTISSRIYESFPNCTIVPNEGFCMGSGWLILFLPLVVAFAYLRIRYLAHKLQ